LNKVTKIFFLLAAMLLTAVVGAGVLSAAEVVVAENNVEWAATNGDNISSIKPGVTASFIVRDDALETTTAGTRTITLSDTAAAGGEFGIALGTSSGTVSTTTLSAAGYNTSAPADTPISATPVVTAGGGSVLVTTFNAKTGTFKLAADVTGEVSVAFSYHTADSWAGSDSALRRAKVSSTSDLEGEWVTISEVDSLTSSTASSTSRVFRGSVALSSDAGAQGSSGSGVWVQDTDDLTVNYYDGSGNIVDSDAIKVDGVDPVIANILPATAENTSLVNPTVTFDVTDSGSGIDPTGVGITMSVQIAGTGTPPITPPATDAQNISFQGIADGLHAIYAGGLSWKTATSSVDSGAFGVEDSKAFDITVTATDKAGNSATSSVTVTIDTLDPAMVSAVAGTARTAVAVTFTDASGAIDSTTIDASDFTVEDATVSAAAIDADNALLVNLTLASDLAPDATPKVNVLAGSIYDKAGNSAAAKEVSATDSMKPAITNTDVLDKALAVKADVVNVRVEADERLASGWPKVSIVGPSGSPVNGLVSMTRPDVVTVNIGASSAIATTDVTGQYGVAIQFSDGPNTDTNLTAVSKEKHTLAAASTTLTLSNGPIADTDFDGDVDAADISAISGKDTAGVDVAVVSINAGTRVVTLGVAAAIGDVEISYSYVASHVFEVDQSAPTVVYVPVKPASGAVEIQDQSPFIQVKFTDDSYVGDTFKAVSLTKAELTSPDATTTDVSGDFVARTTSEYLWAASNLALGSYTLTISGTDTAGNVLADDKYLFKIVERTFAIALQPGWNLVSVPDSPESAAVNDVFSASEIQTVITRDRTVIGGWAIAERDASGVLVGVDPAPLTTVDPGKGYWVESTGIVTLTVNVPGISAGSLQLPPAFRLAAGWNLVSVAQPNLDSGDRDADEYFSGLDWARAYGYNASSKKFVPILPDGLMANAGGATVEVGAGYFVYLNKSGTLVP